MLDRCSQGGVDVYRSAVLDRCGVPHAFGTRQGGERDIIQSLGLIEHELVVVRQVHGHAVHVVEPGRGSVQVGSPCEADAVVLHRPMTATRVLTADCVPVLLSTMDGRRVGAVHAGWRGVLSGVVAEAVAVLGAPFVAAIGPCIGVLHFEVGESVAEQFDDRFVRRDLGPRPHVDLPAAVFDQLSRLGAAQIDTTDRCTAEHESEFFSHRRDVTHRGATTTGRMASVIGCT